MIAIRGLEKSFGSARVLRGIDLHIGDGEVVALIGRSGCGKTTLLRCINFLEEYDAGEIRLDGEELWYRTGAEGVRRALTGTNAAVVGLLAAALWTPVWTSAVTGPVDVAVAAVGFALLLTGRVPPIAVVGLCAVLGELI